MASPSHMDKELQRVQDCEKRAYRHLRRQLGLNPLPSRSPTSPTPLRAATAAPPPIPARNPARDNHYTFNQKDAESCSLSQSEFAKQGQQAQHNSQTVEKSCNDHGEEIEAPYADHERGIDKEKKSDAMMDDLSNAIGLALDEWKDASNHN